jgi:glycosyltransferase involved in cell wall biosynthesis
MRILHIIDRLTAGGPTRSLIALAKQQRRLGTPYEHRVVTLRQAAYPLALVLARQAGLDVLREPPHDELREEITAADIVQVHFWNNPDFYDFLYREWPASRLLLWFKVLGGHAPQVITTPLADYADFCVATSPRTLELPALAGAVAGGRAATVPGIADFDRLAGCTPQPHEGLNIGYIGTVNFSKMHPRFVEMSAAVKNKESRFVVCGGGIEEKLKQQAADLGAGDRFSFRGFVENIAPVLQSLDVFGYPLCEDTYATSEKSLQEAMYAGVPPVVFPHGGVGDLVRDGETGVVVTGESEYTAAIEHLCENPDERERLGRNAREHVRAHFSPEAAARSFGRIYEQMMESPKVGRSWRGEGSAPTPAARFAAAVGDAAPQFRASLAGPDQMAEDRIAKSSHLLSAGEGGIFHYRNTFPQDPFLHFWAGLALLGDQRLQDAGREFQAALELGLDQTPARKYLECVKEPS